MDVSRLEVEVALGSVRISLGRITSPDWVGGKLVSRATSLLSEVKGKNDTEPEDDEVVSAFDDGVKTEKPDDSVVVTAPVVPLTDGSIVVLAS